MDTNKLKRFASEARNILISGVNQRLSALGFSMDGSVTERPELKGGGAVFMGDIQTEDFYHKWMSLYHRVQSHSYREVVEEAAYTWFNRLVAIRIMVKNELVPPILEYESVDVRIPLLVTEAHQGRMPQMNEESRQKLDTLLLNDALTNEQFQVLIVAYCHSNPIINKCFGSISDYTELLLPSNILKNDGLIERLNADDYITDEDYHSPELIGWLYQFYISERKDEVFAKKGKFEADEIPAATQIFTPNWIVKYMVQNTVGRIYLDNNPYSGIKEGMQYLVEVAEPTPADSIYQFEDIHDLTCADLGCGSGHILNECFDLLYQIYIEEGYNRKKAVEDIFQYNLTGVDIDTRAKQLATFALLMKACQKDKSFADAHCMPKVLDMPEAYENKDNLRDTLPHFLLGNNKEMMDEIIAAIQLMDEAKTLGSIMKFDISERTRNAITVRTEEYEKMNVCEGHIGELLPYMNVILALTRNYSVLVMNPPYMGGGNMNEVLSGYVKDNYGIGKADLATVFVQHMADLTCKHGKYAFIIPPSWMFLSTFESLRCDIIDNRSIDSLLHLSRGVFGADFGASAAVISNTKNENAAGTYFRLIERTFQEFDQKHLRLLFEKTLANHKFKFCFADYTKDIEDVVYSVTGAKIYYPAIPQCNFEKIPGSPIGYWVSEKILARFAGNLALSAVAKPCVGLQTADNARFLRLWFEVSLNRIGFGCENAEEALEAERKWFPCNKGGSMRKWYGNQDYIINWENDGYEIKNFADEKGKQKSVIRNPKYYFRDALSWSSISSGILTFRYYPSGFIFDHAACNLYCDNFLKVHAYLNTKLFRVFSDVINPTLNMFSGAVGNVPMLEIENVDYIVSQNISISKQDWDAHETSWNFETNEIVSLDTNDKYVDTIHEIYEGTGLIVDLAAPQLDSLEWRTNIIKQKWEDKFMRLHANEEELNRQFIEIYGLQDELTPDVPLSEVTILQQGEIDIIRNMHAKLDYDGDDPNESYTLGPEVIHWNDDALMKQLISYAVGCMMGRYSIDKPGLILANQGDGQKEYEALVPNSRFEIDDDGIIPLMSANTEFTDNITLRFKTWLSTTFGEQLLIENLNYIERSLGKRLDDYFVKDFWKDHKKMYQNRPIYWLFSSKKGSFQCIVYMHRMNAYTAEKVRTNYLLPHIEWLLTKQSEMQANAANLSTRERKELDNIGKQIDECREYHDCLHVVADKQIYFDLDDGVVVNYAKFGNVIGKLK